MADEPATTPTPWTVTIDGTDVPLHITLDAIIGIEQTTGRALFEHANAASARAVPLNHLALILMFLAGPDCPVAELRAPAAIAGIPGLLMPIAPEQERAAMATILRNGMVDVLARVMVPILAALRAGVTEAGDQRPGFTMAA